MVNEQCLHSDRTLWPSAGNLGLVTLIAAGWRTFRERRQLGRLEPHLLADIGVTPEMARQEASRPFWQLPARYLR